MVIFQFQVASNFRFDNASTNRLRNDELALVDVYYMLYFRAVAIFGYAD